MSGWARLSLLLLGECFVVKARAISVRTVFVWSYFLWDALDATINFDDLGFLIHGAFVQDCVVF